jgi:hypothetical protein
MREKWRNSNVHQQERNCWYESKMATQLKKVFLSCVCVCVCARLSFNKICNYCWTGFSEELPIKILHVRMHFQSVTRPARTFPFADTAGVLKSIIPLSNWIRTWRIFMELHPKTHLNTCHRFYGWNSSTKTFSRVEPLFYCHVSSCAPVGVRWSYVTSPACHKKN